MPGRNGPWMTVWAVCLAQVVSAAEPPKPIPQWAPRDGDVLVLLGDDLTQQAGYSQHLENFFLTRHPDRSIRVVNAGVQGSLTRDALDRFMADIAVHQPTHVAVLLGMSDTGLAPYRDDRFEEFQRNIVELNRRIRELDAEPIYLSPAMFDAQAIHKRPAIERDESFSLINATLAYYGVWLCEFAAEANAAFVDLHGAMTRLMRQARQNDPAFTMLPDGHQPDSAGQLIIAATILHELGLARPLSAIQILCDSEMRTATAEGGSVHNLHVAPPGTVSFLWQAEAIPWDVPADAPSAEELLHLAERFNRETLRVQGLAVGTYELRIDDRLIGQFSQDDFEQGIDLHLLPTPQAEQARRIAAGNRDRTEALIRPARADWSVMQELARRRREANELPDDAERRQTLETMEPWLAGFTQRQAQWTTAAEISLAQLQEQAQPVPRRFLIRPVLAAEVQGRVLIGGMPVSGALVELHGGQGLSAVGMTDAMGFYRLTAQLPDGIPAGDGWLVVLAQMVLPKFISLEQSGHRVTLRSGLNEFELHFESDTAGQ